MFLTLLNQGGMGWTAPSTVLVVAGARAVTGPVCAWTEERAMPWMVTVAVLQAGEERCVNSTARSDDVGTPHIHKFQPDM